MRSCARNATACLASAIRDEGPTTTPLRGPPPPGSRDPVECRRREPIGHQPSRPRMRRGGRVRAAASPRAARSRSRPRFAPGRLLLPEALLPCRTSCPFPLGAVPQSRDSWRPAVQHAVSIRRDDPGAGCRRASGVKDQRRCWLWSEDCSPTPGRVSGGRGAPIGGPPFDPSMKGRRGRFRPRPQPQKVLKSTSNCGRCRVD